MVSAPNARSQCAVRDRGVRALRQPRDLAGRGAAAGAGGMGLGSARRGRALVRRPGARTRGLMATIVLSSFDVANFPDGGGHFWVYMQYALGLRRCGCDVYWMERFVRGADEDRDAAAMAAFFDRMESFGLGGRAILISAPEAHSPWPQP